MSTSNLIELQVYVTQEHITKGTLCSHKTCAVALALLSIPEVQDVVVGQTICRIKYLNQWYRANIPWEVEKFIRIFDEQTLVPADLREAILKPFSFTLTCEP